MVDIAPPPPRSVMGTRPRRISSASARAAAGLRNTHVPRFRRLRRLQWQQAHATISARAAPRDAGEWSGRLRIRSREGPPRILSLMRGGVLVVLSAVLAAPSATAAGSDLPEIKARGTLRALM